MYTLIPQKQLSSDELSIVVLTCSPCPVKTFNVTQLSSLQILHFAKIQYQQLTYYLNLSKRAIFTSQIISQSICFIISFIKALMNSNKANSIKFSSFALNLIPNNSTSSEAQLNLNSTNPNNYHQIHNKN
jgi:hypothetical protein